MATRKSKKSKAPNDENSLNYTLNDSYWMDSFDKMVEPGKKPLRERNIFKRNVRVSYNRDSSLENPTTDEEEPDGGVIVVSSTPRFKSAPKSYSRGKKSSINFLKPPGQELVARPSPSFTSKLTMAKNMFFNFISTPSNRKSDRSLNLSAIVSSEGEQSIWKKVSFPNISNFLQTKRRSSPAAGEDEGRKMLKTPDKEEERERKWKKRTTRISKKETVGLGGKTSNGRTSDKPRVLFNLGNAEDSEDGGKDKADAGRKTENFVLKPGKWRKSIANIRRTINTGAEPRNGPGPKQSVMFTLPESDSEKDRQTGADGEGGTGRWTRGPRISQYHPGRRRKSIFIVPRAESIIVIDEVDEPGPNQSQDREYRNYLFNRRSQFENMGKMYWTERDRL